jgi:hypothetical protein
MSDLDYLTGQQETRIPFGDGPTDTMPADWAERFIRHIYQTDRATFARVMAAAIFGADLPKPGRKANGSN